MSWRDFEDALARRGRPLECWWRDDDAGAPCAPLKVLIQLSETHSVPLALAVVPEAADAGLFGLLHEGVNVIQHGTDHRNRASPGEKKTEYPASEPVEAALERISDGLGRLRALAGARLQPVLAPPWNRIRKDLLKKLPAIGIRGLSQYGPRVEAVPSLQQVNTHVDIIDWQGSRGFIGEQQALGLFQRNFSAQEPLGLLTHHAVHDAAAWKFLERLFTLRNIRWLSAAEAFSYTSPAHG